MQLKLVDFLGPQLCRSFVHQISFFYELVVNSSFCNHITLFVVQKKEKGNPVNLEVLQGTGTVDGAA